MFARHDPRGRKKPLPLTTRAIANIFAALCAEAGIEKGEVTPHRFRHYCATKVYRATHNLATVADLLGHTNLGTTNVYAQATFEDVLEAHKKTFGE